jgi:hypothetical protein
MRGEIEGRLFIRAWSMRHEGLLERVWPDRYKPISLWTSTFYVSHREVEKLQAQLPVSQAPASPIKPGLTHGTDFKAFKIWGMEGSEVFSFDATAVSNLRKIGNNSGLRWWFLCRHCDHRAAALYFGNHRLACRKCQGLAYQSEKLTRKERATNRVLSGRARAIEL